MSEMGVHWETTLLSTEQLLLHFAVAQESLVATPELVKK
jgi:hypothetical protein